VRLMKIWYDALNPDDPAMAELLTYVPQLVEDPIREWRRVANRSTTPSVVQAAFLAIAAHHYRYNHYEQAQAVLDTLSKTHGMTKGHPRHGAEFSAMRRGIERLGIGVALPPLRAETLSGGYVDTAHLRGTVVLLYFYGSTCGACVPKYPTLNRLHETYSRDTFRLIGIPSDAAGWLSKNQFRDFMAEYDITWPQA